MNYTKNSINTNTNNTIITSANSGENKTQTDVCVFSNPSIALTTYKTVVDIPINNTTLKTKYYGLSIYDYERVKLKKRRQIEFLARSYIYDKLSNNKIPLSTITFSANINPNRYYSEIQNRINTLVNEAEHKNLKPIFMTLTLPSAYHKMKYNKKTKKLIPNPKYNNTSPAHAVKELTKMFAKLRHDRSLKELTKNERIYYRVNEPHKDGTPHTHILLYVPNNTVQRVVNAFKRLFNTKANDIQTNINNPTAYIMKYINKTLPLSKQKDLSIKDKYLNAWYSRNRIIRFNSSRTLAPLKLYRLLYSRYTLQELTRAVNNKELQIFVLQDDRSKIMEILDGDELIYMKSDNFKLKKAS